MTFQYDEEVVHEDENHEAKWVTYEYEVAGGELGDALVEVLTDLYFGELIKSGVPRDKVKQAIDTFIFEIDYETLANEFEERLAAHFREEARRQFREKMNLI